MRSVEELVAGVLKGNKRAVARAISIIEDGRPEAAELLNALEPHTGRAYVIGVTGATGSGKSTLIHKLARAYRLKGHKVGVVAIDPTSPFSGGAILGDRIRMQRHATNPNVFIRSVSCAENPEGVSRTVKDLLKIMALSGMDYIIVETVGTGQMAVEVSYICHTTVLVLMPNMGDDIQMMKAGIIESADIFVINKCDLDGAELTEAYLRDNIEKRDGWMPPIIKTVGYNRATVKELVDKIKEHIRKESCRYREKIRGLLMTMFLDYLDELGLEFIKNCGKFEELVDDVASCRKDYYTATEELFEMLKKEVLKNDKGN